MARRTSPDSKVMLPLTVAEERQALARRSPQGRTADQQRASFLKNPLYERSFPLLEDKKVTPK
jgi:hypothetical protein